MSRYNDYGSMQQAAQRRVYEMQRRQRAALEQNRCACPTRAPEPVPEYFSQHEEEQITQSPPVQPTEPLPVGKPESDPEAFLLMAVLALLVSEKADPRLIAALLYII